MRDLVRAGKKESRVRQTALDLVKDFPGKAWGAEVRALFIFVRDRIRFVRDINSVETLHTPTAVLEIGQGDCDDKSVLLASLLESIGHPTRFVAVGRMPDEYEHVLVETKLGTDWVPLDSTEKVDVGWYPPDMISRLVMYN